MLDTFEVDDDFSRGVFGHDHFDGAAKAHHQLFADDLWVKYIDAQYSIDPNDFDARFLGYGWHS